MCDKIGMMSEQDKMGRLTDFAVRTNELFLKTQHVDEHHMMPQKFSKKDA